MKRSCAVVLTVLTFLPLGAVAQNVDIFAGYSFMRYSGPSFRQFSNLNGWNASVTNNFNKYFGLKADFNGEYGSGSREPIFCITFPCPTAGRQHVKFYTFLFGPQFRYQRGKAVLFGHTLFGPAHGVLGRLPDLPVTFPDGTVRILTFPPRAATSFASGLGGGLDLNVSKRLAIRVAQLDYIRSNIFGTQNNLRYSPGFILRF